MKRPAAFFLSLLVFAAAALFGAPARAQDEPSPEPPRLRLELDQLNPRVITGSAKTLTVSGTVTNIGDRRIARPQVRLQVGERLTSDRELKGVLAGEPIQDNPLTDFTTLTESLEPGQSARLDVTVPLTGQRAGQLSRTGVYPMLVNVNGTPEFGGPARLAAVSLLMPVLSGPARSETPSGKRADVSVLWPITDSAPHVLSAPYGGPLTLTDDTLATELDVNGRLYSLVAAARAAEQSNQRVADSLCFAVDPDLLRTVDAMTRGYVVAGAPGKGTQAAKDWMIALQQLVNGHCVIALPFADADLTTLGKVRSASGTPDSGLLSTALSGEATIHRLLGTDPRKGVLWPGGTPDDQALTAMSAAGVHTVLTDGSKLQSDSPVTGATTLPGGLRAQPIDGLIASAMVGSEPNPQTPTTVSAATQPAIASQNGLAAIAFEAGLGRGSEGAGSQLLVAPPRRWDVPQGELSAFLDHLGQLLAGGLGTGAPLTQLLDSDASGSASLAAGTHDQPASPGGDVTETLSNLDGQAAGLLSAMRMDATRRVQPEDIVAPVRDALVRGASTAFGTPSGSAAGSNAHAELAAIRDQVTVEQPKQTIALASGSSPLPVFVSNELPVGITAQIALKNNVGIRPEQAQNWFFPAKGGKNELIQIEALRAGRLSVDVSLTTPAGTELGTTARFELTSTEYGPITIIITVVAGCALLLLASRRIYRRVKESRAARTETR
ncbi:DUF6049 family protein [Amycolatopsis sp. FDAARGOS 1241]|uniref:DUF6049 family protein n=1 Tax=Amycolatopsis sp. FDAARGOS 1241 TaxID=2778070 RepID=UPI001951E17A|nr:DUF6049 family protein [Amycolatopsis sp. FDAARGOS 1241]QRP46080.1 glycoprotein [Amycolatopsis sp. FDAARGOS 1241]